MAKRAKRVVTQEQIDEIEAERVMHGYAPPPVPQEPTPEDVKAYEEQQDEEASEGEGEQDGEPTSDSEVEGSAMVEMEDGEGEERVPNSIVKDKFKIKYIENAQAQGLTSKAAKRSNWDWLSQQLATFCLSDKGKIDIGAFTDVLDANGIDHSKWTNRNKGWEGRFRMTGRVALQKVVANSGVLKWPGELEDTAAPSEFVERFKTKA